MTNKIFICGILFIVYVMCFIAGICLAAFGKNTYGASLILGSVGVAIIMFVYTIWGRND